MMPEVLTRSGWNLSAKTPKAAKRQKKAKTPEKTDVKEEQVAPDLPPPPPAEPKEQPPQIGLVLNTKFFLVLEFFVREAKYVLLAARAASVASKKKGVKITNRWHL